MKDFILKLDKDRALRFGFKSLRMIKAKFGVTSLDKLMAIEVDEIPVVVHAGLQWEDKELTLEQVEDLLDAAIPANYTIIGVTTLVLEALAAQMGVEVDVKKTIASELEEVEEEKKKKPDPKKKIPSSKKPKKPH